MRDKYIFSNKYSHARSSRLSGTRLQESPSRPANLHVYAGRDAVTTELEPPPAARRGGACREAALASELRALEEERAALGELLGAAAAAHAEKVAMAAEAKAVTQFVIQTSRC